MNMNSKKLIFKIRSGQIYDIILREIEAKKHGRNRKGDQKFQKLISLHKYKEALSYGVAISDSSPGILKDLSACAYFSDEYELSTEYMKKYLANNNAPVTDFYKRIEELLVAEENLQFTFKGQGGFSNCGFILIDGQNSKYIGKIMELSRDSLRELYFFENMMQNLQMDASIPVYYGSVQQNNYICLITGYYPAAKTAALFDRRFYDLLLKLMKFQKEDVCFPKNRYLHYKGNCEAGLLHKKHANEYIIATIRQNLELAKAEDLLFKIERLNDCIVGRRLYKHIDSQYHYGFCHNDYHRNNLLSCTDSICILDWGNYSYLLKGWDLTYYLGNFELAFPEISDLIEKDIYPTNEKHDLIGRIFLVFAFVYVWSSRLHGAYAPEQGANFFIPAIQYIEKNTELFFKKS